MAAQNPSEYIAHHLTNLTVTVGEGGFWTLNMDTIVMSWALGLVGLGLIWMVAKGATAGVPPRGIHLRMRWRRSFVRT